jgi:hypothetical protein
MGVTPEPDPRPSRRSPGQIALSIMGWLELAISVTLFILQVYVASVFFGVAALFLSFVAVQVQRQQRRYLRQTGELVEIEGVDASAHPGIAFWVLLVAGGVLVVLSLIVGLLGNMAYAVNFVLWGLVLAVFAQRVALTARG